MRRAAVAALVTTFAFPMSALAHSHYPPSIHLITNDKVQRGQLGTFCWTRTTPTGGGTLCADAVWSFPNEFRRTPAGDPAVLRIRRSERPDHLSLYGYREIDENDIPQDEGERLPTHLRRMRRDGEVVGWRARFRTPNEPGHLYLDLFARWDPGDASYTFHLKLV